MPASPRSRQSRCQTIPAEKPRLARPRARRTLMPRNAITRSRASGTNGRPDTGISSSYRHCVASAPCFERRARSRNQIGAGHGIGVHHQKRIGARIGCAALNPKRSAAPLPRRLRIVQLNHPRAGCLGHRRGRDLCSCAPPQTPDSRQRSPSPQSSPLPAATAPCAQSCTLRRVRRNHHRQANVCPLLPRGSAPACSRLPAMHTARSRNRGSAQAAAIATASTCIKIEFALFDSISRPLTCNLPARAACLPVLIDCLPTYAKKSKLRSDHHPPGTACGA